jgi:hypothetical protein
MNTVHFVAGPTGTYSQQRLPAEEFPVNGRVSYHERTRTGLHFRLARAHDPQEAERETASSDFVHLWGTRISSVGRHCTASRLQSSRRSHLGEDTLAQLPSCPARPARATAPPSVGSFGRGSPPVPRPLAGVPSLLHLCRQLCQGGVTPGRASATLVQLVRTLVKDHACVQAAGMG